MMSDYLLPGVVIPALVSGAVFVLVGGLWRRKWNPDGSLGRMGAVAGLGSGFVLGYGLFRGWPVFPPPESLQWLVYIVILAMGVGCLEVAPLKKRWVRWPARVFLVAALEGTLLRPMVLRVWGTWEAVAWLAAVGILFLCVWMSSLALAERWDEGLQALNRTGAPGFGSVRGRAWLFPAVMTVIAAGTDVTLGLSSTLLLPQLGGMLTAAVAAQAVVLFFRPIRGWEIAAWPVVSVVLFGLWLAGLFYAKLHPICDVLLVLSLLSPWLGRWGLLRRVRLSAGLAWDIAVPMVCVVAAVVVAYYTSAPLGL